MHKSHSWATLILLLISSASVMAQQPTLVISDKNVVITGDLTTSPTSFSKTISITLTGLASGQTKVLSVTRSELKDASGKFVLDRKEVTIPQVTLENDRPQDISIAVSNITRPGIYSGEITFWVEPNKTDAQIVRLTVEMKPKIELKASIPAKVHFVRCSPFPCPYTNWLPDVLVGNKRTFILDNETVVDLPISVKDILLRGENRGELLRKEDFKLTLPKEGLGARQSAAVEVEIPAIDNVQADHYSGTMRFSLNGYDTQPLSTTPLMCATVPGLRCWFCFSESSSGD